MDHRPAALLRRERLSRIVRNETWTAKAEYLSDIVMGHVNPVLRSASMSAANVGPWSDPQNTEEAAISPAVV